MTEYAWIPPDSWVESAHATSLARSLGVVPAEIRFTAALPKTRSAKIVRRAVRATVLGEDAGDLSTLEDPAAIESVRAAS